MVDTDSPTPTADHAQTSVSVPATEDVKVLQNQVRELTTQLTITKDKAKAQEITAKLDETLHNLGKRTDRGAIAELDAILHERIPNPSDYKVPIGVAVGGTVGAAVVIVIAGVVYTKKGWRKAKAWAKETGAKLKKLPRAAAYRIGRWVISVSERYVDEPFNAALDQLGEVPGALTAIGDTIFDATADAATAVGDGLDAAAGLVPGPRGVVRFLGTAAEVLGVVDRPGSMVTPDGWQQWGTGSMMGLEKDRRPGVTDIGRDRDPTVTFDLPPTPVRDGVSAAPLHDLEPESEPPHQQVGGTTPEGDLSTTITRTSDNPEIRDSGAGAIPPVDVDPLTTMRLGTSVAAVVNADQVLQSIEKRQSFTDYMLEYNEYDGKKMVALMNEPSGPHPRLNPYETNVRMWRLLGGEFTSEELNLINKGKRAANSGLGLSEADLKGLKGMTILDRQELMAELNAAFARHSEAEINGILTKARGDYHLSAIPKASTRLQGAVDYVGHSSRGSSSSILSKLTAKNWGRIVRQGGASLGSGIIAVSAAKMMSEQCDDCNEAQRTAVETGVITTLHGTGTFVVKSLFEGMLKGATAAGPEGLGLAVGVLTYDKFNEFLKQQGVDVRGAGAAAGAASALATTATAATSLGAISVIAANMSVAGAAAVGETAAVLAAEAAAAGPVGLLIGTAFGLGIGLVEQYQQDRQNASNLKDLAYARAHMTESKRAEFDKWAAQQQLTDYAVKKLGVAGYLTQYKAAHPEIPQSDWDKMAQRAHLDWLDHNEAEALRELQYTDLQEWQHIQQKYKSPAFQAAAWDQYHKEHQKAMLAEYQARQAAKQTAGLQALKQQMETNVLHWQRTDPKGYAAAAYRWASMTPEQQAQWQALSEYQYMPTGTPLLHSNKGTTWAGVPGEIMTPWIRR